jgi:chromosome partitioning protein
MSVPTDEWITCEEFAKLEGISVRAVQARCARGTLPCQKHGNTWKINKTKYDRQKGKYLILQKKDKNASTQEDTTVKSTIVFTNAKGGVGKTTLSVVTADKLSMMGYKVLLVDMDPQGNATSFAGLRPYKGSSRPGRGEYKTALHDVLIGKVLELYGQGNTVRTADAIYKAREFYILPTDNRAERIKYWLLDNAHAFPTSMDIYIAWTQQFPFLLKYAIEEVEKDFDFIVIDTPPEQGWATRNAMMCATDVVVPIELGNFEVLGLEQVFAFIDECAKQNPLINILGIVISRFGPHRSRLDTDFEDQLRNHEVWGPYMFDSVIYRTLLVREATNSYQSVFEYWRKGLSKDSVQSLEDFTDELITKLFRKELENETR